MFPNVEDRPDGFRSTVMRVRSGDVPYKETLHHREHVRKERIRILKMIRAHKQDMKRAKRHRRRVANSSLVGLRELHTMYDQMYQRAQKMYSVEAERTAFAAFNMVQKATS